MYANRETNSSIYDIKKMPVLLVTIIMLILCLPPYFFSSVVLANLNSENIMNLLLKEDAQQRLIKVV